MRTVTRYGEQDGRQRRIPLIPGTSSPLPAAHTKAYPDLGATVRRDDEPGGDFGFRLLYETCFGLPEPPRAYDGSQPLHECRLELPAFRVRFFVAGRTAHLLGSLREPDQTCADRVCRAVFRAFPRVLRLLVEVRGSDPLMGLMRRTLAEGGDYVVSVPPTAEEYVALLGKATRRNLRLYEARFRRECPGGELKMVAGEALTANIAKQVVDWNVGRMRAKGIVSKYEKLPDLRGALTEFTVRQGQAAAVWCGPKLVSGVLGTARTATAGSRSRRVTRRSSASTWDSSRGTGQSLSAAERLSGSTWGPARRRTRSASALAGCLRPRSPSLEARSLHT
jgi:hypothetical protein